MNNSFAIGKRAFTIAIAAATILWSVGFASFVAPMSASAAAAGDVIKGTTLSTLYYYAADGQRYAFPNQKSYLTWYPDFSGVVTISDSALAAIPLAGNVVYRPGSRWIKIQSDPKTYAVTPQGKIRWIESEAVASGLAGANWNTFIDDVPDVFFVDYTVGPSLVSASSGFNGMLVAGSNNLIWNGQKRLISSAGFTANRYQTRSVLAGPGVNLSSIPAGSEVTGKESKLVDAAQLGDTVTGGLSVSLASDTPASATIPAAAASVPFLKVKLTASTGSVVINEMTFRLGGVGVPANFGDVFLYEGNTRMTQGRNINASTRTVSFSTLNIDLAAGESTYLILRADIDDAPEVGDTANFQLAATNAIVGTATVSGNFPIVGNNMTFSGTPAGLITIDESGTLANPTIGAKDAVIGKFSAEMTDEDGYVHNIALTVDDASSHSNFKLWTGSTLLASCQNATKDLVTCVLTSPLFIEDGDMEVLKLTADIGGEADEDIRVFVEEAADVQAIGSVFGFNLQVDIDGYDDSVCDDAGDQCSLTNIQGGKLTFAFNGPVSDDIMVDGKDQVLMKFSITAQNWVEINELGLILNGTDLLDGGGDAYLTDIAIRKTSGIVWMGPEECDDANDNVEDLTYTDNQVLAAGETLDLLVTVDVDAATPPNETYSVDLDMGAVDAEDANGDNLLAGDVVPSADIVGNDFDTAVSGLTVDASTPPGDATYVKGVSNINVVGFSYTAGSVSDVTVTDVQYTVYGDTDGAFSGESDVKVTDHVSSCSMYNSESGALIDGPESPVDDDADADIGLIAFENFTWTIPAGETKKSLLRCNLSNVDTEDGDDDAYAFFIDDVDTEQIIAEDDGGEAVDEVLNENNEDGSEAVMLITNAGTVAVTLDGSTPKDSIILGATTGVTVAKFKFDATDEAFTIRMLTFANGGDDSVAANVKISYPDATGATKTKTGYLAAGVVTFDNLDFFVPADALKTVTVSIDTNGVSSTGAVSGDTLDLTLDADATGFEAVGASSNETVDDAGADVGANEMTLRKTKPTISLASGSPSGAGIPGLAEVLRFNVSADSRGFITLDQVAFKVTSADNNGTDWNVCDGGPTFDDPDLWEIYDLADPSTKLDDDTDWTFTDIGGACAGNDLAYAVLNFNGDATTGPEEIGAGETKTYVLKVDTTGASSSDDDSIRIDLPDQTTIDNDLGDDAIVWDDDVEGANIDGTNVKNLPVTGGAIVY